MPGILHQIRYDNDLLKNVKENLGRQQIKETVAKLQSLAADMEKEPKGCIEILRSGNIFTVGFSDDLDDRINALLD